MYRPPQYAKAQLYSVACTLPHSEAEFEQLATSGGDAAGTPTTFYFDAVMRAEHSEEVVLTRHPVQNGASITDHAYAAPARLVLEVGFSDLMESFVFDQYTGGNSSKSVNAFQQFQRIKNLRLPCTVSTRLCQYDNMVIEHLAAPETAGTLASARVVIRFLQIIVARVDSQAVSARPQQTDSTDGGVRVPLRPTAPIMGFEDPLAEVNSWSSNKP